MAENNEFIREVDEDYRRDRILQIWKRYSGVIIALAVLLSILVACATLGAAAALAFGPAASSASRGAPSP